ncbi:MULTISPECIES: hypothetical protein [Pseudomonas]|uniref:Lipoprotein n=1 Tax=Pseudomonas koreensis TaxID=198620 RepID=A0A9X3BB10_9PSED|nr:MULTISPECIES: hypothetical protein [Pseudomonas]MBV4477648.1 hypothetical protein [Pseudomonas botevensis]MCU7247970.1 hypothetical protein [Pseudomonas koreensis]
MDLKPLTTLLLATLLTACTSPPKEKTEYEKQLDAVAMPTNEADRLLQCKNLSDMYWLELMDEGSQGKTSSWLNLPDYSRTIAIKKRRDAMNCPRLGKHPWLPQ